MYIIILYLSKVTGGNSVKNDFQKFRYDFTSTLAIEMYLGKHDAYSILNTSQARWAAAILPCCDSLEKQFPVGLQNVRAKNFLST